MGYVYIITNTENEKVYIGQTIHTPEYRFIQHVWKSRKNTKTKFYVALREIGADKFSVKALIECDNSELNKYEQYYVNKYNSIKEGYNSVYPCSTFHKENEMNYKDIIEDMLDDGYSIVSIATYIGSSAKYVYEVIDKYKLNRKSTDNYIVNSKEKPIIMYDKNFNFIRSFESIKEGLKWLNDNTEFKITSFGAYYYINIACKNGNIAYNHRWQLKSDLEYDNKIFRTKFDKEAYINGLRAYIPDGSHYYIVDGVLESIKTVHVKNYCLDCGKEIESGNKRCKECHLKYIHKISSGDFKSKYICKKCKKPIEQEEGLCMSCRQVEIKGKTPKPSKEKLQELLCSGLKINQIAKMYNRSDSTVHYWIKQYKLK